MAEDANRKEAERILRRVARESEVIGTSNVARQRDGEPGGEEERIDRIGTRIGRSLGYAAVFALLIYLYFVYFA